MFANPTVLGRLTLPEPVQYTDRSFPTASWWRRLTLQPGGYDVVGTYTPEAVRAKAQGEEVTPYWLKVAVPGVTVDEYFVSRLFTASMVDEPKIGAWHLVHLSAYGYQADRLPAALGPPSATVEWVAGALPAEQGVA